MNAPAYRRDGVPVSRDDFYATACDPRCSVVVEACAGAGKTWMLVARIVRALLDGVPPQAVLAITFTRKAAGEMRERLDALLRELAQADRETRAGLLVARGMAPDVAAAAADAAGALLDRVLDGGRPVDVQTFHGWFAQLLRAAPWDLLDALGIPAQAALVEDTDDLWSPLLHRLHRRVLGDDALQADYRTLVARRGRATLLRWLESAWQRRVEVEQADRAGTLDAAVPAVPGPDGSAAPADVRLRDPALRASWLELARQLAAAGGKVAATAAADAIVEATALADDSAAFEAVFAALHTKERTPRKQLPRVELLPPVLDALAAIADAVAQHEAHLEHAAMARLSRVLLAEYAALKRERGLVDMNDLELVGWRMLGDPVLAGWVQQRLDARIRHLLIDEFQDTSPLQWHALRSWLSAYAGAGGGEAVSVFLVGDPKQSIYRFRRAEPRVFTAATDFVRRALGGRLLACDHTRRCAPGVLAVVNGVFEPLAAAATFAGFRAHTTEVDAGAAPGDALRLLERVERSPRRPRGADPAPADWRPSLHEPRVEAEDLPREAEAARVADAVQALLAEGFGPGDILVLARRRAPLRLAAAALQARHVACTAADDTPLGELPEVRDLVAVLDTLASPAHDLSLAQALKSPLFGADDDDLMRLASAAAGSGWWDALQALSDAEASPALRRARDLLGRWAGLAAGLPPHDLLDRIVAEGDLMARLAAAVPPERWPLARQAVRAVLRQSLLLDGGRYASVYAFVRALRRRKLVLRHDGDDDAVRLLTVHGAKGLEARAVVLMDCDPEPPSADTATLLVDWPVEHEAPRGVAFVASEARIAPSLRDALAEERAQRQREELNGLYVALTRAAERLVVSATAPARGGGASWWNLLAPLAAAASPSAPQRATLSPLLPASRVGVLPVVALAPAAVPTPRPAATVDDASARLGSAVHRLLEWLTGTAAAAGSNAHAAAQAWAPAAAQAFALPAEMAPEVARRAAVVFASADCQRFFGPGVAWAGNEVPVADAGGCARIDRLVRLDTPDGPEWWVLDYKLAHAPAAVGAYRDQLQRYRAAVQALLPGERVRAAFVTGEGGLVEIAAPDGAAGPDVN